AMNVQTGRATGKSPYTFVFGQDPVQHFSLLEDLHQQDIIDEETLSDNFFEDFNNSDDDFEPEPSASNQLEPSMSNQPEPLIMNQLEPSTLDQPKPSTSDQPKPSTSDQLESSTSNQTEPSMLNHSEPSTSNYSEPSTSHFETSLLNYSELSMVNQSELSISSQSESSMSNQPEKRSPLRNIQNTRSYHQLSREYANKSLAKYRNRMRDQMLKKNKHPLEYSINDYVCISIPKIDRNSIDRHTLPCKIIGELPNKTY
ncbi:7982_t:CDS:1, partial [Cetraspora pellucida]